MHMFSQFFGGEDPFAAFLSGGHGGGGGPGGMFFSSGGDNGMRGFSFGGGGSPFGDIGGMQGGGQRRGRQDPTVQHELPVALEDIYKGCTKKMKITR